MTVFVASMQRDFASIANPAGRFEAQRYGQRGISVTVRRDCVTVVDSRNTLAMRLGSQYPKH